MKTRIIMLLLLASSAFSTFAGVSQLDMDIQALRTYCKDDVERLCPDVQPGGGRIKACLMDKKQQMSVGCAQSGAGLRGNLAGTFGGASDGMD